MVLRYRNHKEIDKPRWDALVEKSINGNIYSLSIYLDHVAPGWAAITDENYAVGIALPLRKKWGISYIYPPFFTQQLGILYTDIGLNFPIENFLQLIPASFRLIELNLHSSNHYNDFKNAGIWYRKNFILPLKKPYEVLAANFSRSAKRNISKAIKNNIDTRENAGINEILTIHRQRFQQSINISSQDYFNFEKLLYLLKDQNMIYAIAAYLNDRIIAGSIFLNYKGRLIFIISGNTAESLNTGATHLLMSEAIRKFSGQDFILDFEGSDNPAFARFYEQYGAGPESYPFIRVNRLPFFLKWLKKKSSF